MKNLSSWRCITVVVRYLQQGFMIRTVKKLTLQATKDHQNPWFRNTVSSQSDFSRAHFFSLPNLFPQDEINFIKGENMQLSEFFLCSCQSFPPLYPSTTIRLRQNNTIISNYYSIAFGAINLTVYCKRACHLFISNWRRHSKRSVFIHTKK